MRNIKATLLFLLSLAAAMAAVPLHAETDASDNSTADSSSKAPSESSTAKESPTSSAGGSAEPECN